MPAAKCPKCNSGRVTIGYSQGRIYLRRRPGASESTDERTLACHSCGYTGPPKPEPPETTPDKSNYDTT
jgi:hypothetical protein